MVWDTKLPFQACFKGVSEFFCLWVAAEMGSLGSFPHLGGCWEISKNWNNMISWESKMYPPMPWIPGNSRPKIQEGNSLNLVPKRWFHNPKQVGLDPSYPLAHLLRPSIYPRVISPHLELVCLGDLSFARYQCHDALVAWNAHRRELRLPSLAEASGLTESDFSGKTIQKFSETSGPVWVPDDFGDW